MLKSHCQPQIYFTYNNTSDFNISFYDNINILQDKNDLQFIKSVELLLQKRWKDEQFNAGMLIESMQMSVYSAKCRFNEVFGMSAALLIKACRLSQARQLLNNSAFYISKAASKCGFSDPKYFSKCFRKAYGMSPKEYRESIASIASLQITNKVAFVDKVMQLLDNNINQSDLKLDSFVDELMVSKSTLYRRVKSVTGQSPYEFIRNYRLKKSVELLLHSQHKIEQIASNVGFTDLKHFSRCFRSQFGITPYSFRKLLLMSAV